MAFAAVLGVVLYGALWVMMQAVSVPRGLFFSRQDFYTDVTLETVLG
jgi:hypothetical protein